MKLIYKFKDGFEHVENLGNEFQNKGEDYLAGLNLAKKNNAILEINTPAGKLEKNSSELDSVEVFFDDQAP